MLIAKKVTNSEVGMSKHLLKSKKKVATMKSKKKVATVKNDFQIRETGGFGK